MASFVVVASGVRQAARIDDLIGVPEKRRDDSRDYAAKLIIQCLLEHHPFAAHHQARLFIYDDELGRLMPSFDPEGVNGSMGWQVGKGVTGHAYKTEQEEVARGSDCRNGKYGLSPHEQNKYRDINVVAATPVMTARGACIAVLTISSETDDGTLVGPSGRASHALLAVGVGRVLIDVLNLARD